LREKNKQLEEFFYKFKMRDEEKKCGIIQNEMMNYIITSIEQVRSLQHSFNRTLSTLHNFIQNYNPQLSLCLFGSFATGLALPWSDIDLVLINNHNLPIDSQELILLHEKLKFQKWISDIKIIMSSSMPVIKMTVIESIGSFQIDISCQNQKHLGIQCAKLIKDYIHEYCLLQPLVLVLKNLLKVHGLNNPYTVYILLNLGRIKFIWVNFNGSLFSTK
jgi:DNA polymerase sigma